jgi:hypothetical protein
MILTGGSRGIGGWRLMLRRLSRRRPSTVRLVADHFAERGSVVEDRRLIPPDPDTASGLFCRLGSRLEELQLFPGDRDVAHDLPAQSTMRPRTPDLDPLGAQRSGRSVRIAQRDASIRLDAFDSADDVAATIVALEPNRFTRSESETGEGRR